jgi:hypothetical protein
MVRKGEPPLEYLISAWLLFAIQPVFFAGYIILVRLVECDVLGANSTLLVSRCFNVGLIVEYDGIVLFLFVMSYKSNFPHSIVSFHIPSGKHTKSYGKSPFLMGKSTINGFFQ